MRLNSALRSASGGGIGIAAGGSDEAGHHSAPHRFLNGVGVDEERWYLAPDGGEGVTASVTFVQLTGLRPGRPQWSPRCASPGTQQTNWGFDAASDADHLRSPAILQVHPGLDSLAQYLHVAVGDVAGDFTQVNRDVIGTGLARLPKAAWTGIRYRAAGIA